MYCKSQNAKIMKNGEKSQKYNKTHTITKTPKLKSINTKLL